MAGHNKWSKIKRQKAKEDKRKSKIWAKLSQEIATAARQGGGDPEANVPLAQAIERAEAENMAKDTIERAIKRGIGELDGEGYEPTTYEGYAPHGVAVFVEAMTNNINRTVADLRYLFETHGGNLGKDGSVGYLFEQKGRFRVSTEEVGEMELLDLVVEAGAEDLGFEQDAFVVTSSVEAFADVESALERADVDVEESRLVRIPTATVSLDADQREQVQVLVEQIVDHDDVEAVFTTLEVDGEPLALTAEDERS